MSLSHRYRQLAALIESLESDGITVEEAEPIEHGEEQSPADRFRVQLSLELPADATVDGFGTDSANIGGSTSLQPVGTYVSPSEQLADGEDNQSEDAVDDTTRARNGSSTAVEERTEATGGEHTAAGFSDSDGAPTAATVVDAEDEDDEDDDGDESGPVGTESTAAADSTAGGTTDDGTEGTADDDTPDEGTTGDETVACTHPDCDRTFDTERGMKIHRTKAHPLSELVDGEHDRTVHHDPSVLARVYDEHDTFAEMTEALDVDVGAQAVRKQMIRHGIHEPAGSSSDDTAPSADDVDDADDEVLDGSEAPDEANADTDASTAALDGDVVEADEPENEEGVAKPESDEDAVEADEPENEEDTAEPDQPESDRDVSEPDQPESDRDVSEPDQPESDATVDSTADEPMVSERLPDLDLPGTLSTADLRSAVEEATTLYDVQRSLGLDRETTRDVLAEYDLLELVSGRAAALRDREELKTEINQRIRRRAT